MLTHLRLPRAKHLRPPCAHTPEAAMLMSRAGWGQEEGHKQTRPH